MKKTKFHTPSFIAAGFIGLAYSASATSIIVTNPSFETQTIADGEAFTTSATTVDAGTSAAAGDSSITGWTENLATDHLGFVLNPGVGSQQATDGNNIAFLQRVIISQTLSGFTLATGDTVSVSFDLWSTNAGNSSTFKVNFAGIGEQSPTAITVGSAPASKTINFIVGAAQDGITSGDLSFESESGGHRYRLDNISVEHTVPEPSSTALLGLGGLALMLRRKR